MKTVWVITWKYVDSSGSGIVTIFQDKNMAEWFLNLITLHGDMCKIFELTEQLVHSLSLIKKQGDLNGNQQGSSGKTCGENPQPYERR